MARRISSGARREADCETGLPRNTESDRRHAARLSAAAASLALGIHCMGIDKEAVYPSRRCGRVQNRGATDAFVPDASRNFGGRGAKGCVRRQTWQLVFFVL